MTILVICLCLCGSVASLVFNRPSFESAWYSIETQNPNVLSIPHDLNEYPVKADVQVKINKDGKDYIFTAMGSAQIDDDRDIDFGGTVYLYNDKEVLISVPTRNNDRVVGGLAYTGSSTNYYGPHVIQGPYNQGAVKVRLWQARDMPDILLNVTSNITTSSVKDIEHGLGFVPDMISVQVFLDDGYVSDGQGAVFNDRAIHGKFEYGGTIFGFDEHIVRLWTPNIYIFFASDGWNIKRTNKQGLVRVLAWTIDSSQKVNQNSFIIGKGLDHHTAISFPRRYDMSKYFISVQVSVSTAEEKEMTFNAIGSTMAFGTVPFGGLVYVYTTTEVLLWRPAGDNGHLIYIGGTWGSGEKGILADAGDVTITVYYLSDDCFSHSPYQTVCTPELIDLVFIIDSSASEDNVTKATEFLNNIISRISLSLSEYQIAVITYNYEPEVLFDLNMRNKSYALSVIQHISDLEGPTYTHKALRMASQMLTTCTNGSRGEGTLQVIVLLSDGLSSDSVAAVTEADKVRNNGGRIFTVGTGYSINHMELLQISNSTDYVFCDSNPDDFYNTIWKESLDPNCPDCIRKTDTDIILLLDTNNNQPISDYLSRQESIQNLISKLITKNSNVKIGMIQFSDEPDITFDLTMSPNKDKLIVLMKQVNRDRVSTTKNTSHALSYSNQYMQINARSTAQKMIILISDGYWTDLQEMKLEIDSLRTKNISVFGIATGTNLVLKNFLDVIADPCHIFYLRDDFTPLDFLAGKTSFYYCE